MYRGTTPSFTFKVDIDIDRITDLSVSFTQGGELKLIKYINDCTLDTNKETISVGLTQEETLELEANKDLHIQLKFEIDGEKVSVSKYINTYVNDIIDDNIM